MKPHAPPSSDVSKNEPARRRPIALIILGLAFVQLVWLALNMASYVELVRTGAASVLTGLFGFVGCVLLYLGAAYFAANPARGNRLFLISAALLVLSLQGWGLRYFFSYPYILGAIIAAAGWWFSRHRASLERT